MRSFASHSVQALRRKLVSNPLKNNPTEQKFEVALNGNTAYVQYEQYGSVYHLVHTSIPKEFHGHGLGHILAERVFDYIAQNNLKMKIICEFLEVAIERHESKYSKFLVV